jgi:hypothetical protein
MLTIFFLYSSIFPAIVEAVDSNDDALLDHAVERAVKYIYEAAEKLKLD